MSFSIQQGLFQFDLIDHHAILGVSLDANAQQIRQRYLKIAYRLHPDTCKAKNEAEKRKASQILSKWVNPAYEQLSKEKSRLEYLLVLSQMGKKLALEPRKITLESEPAQKLSQAGVNIDLVYQKLLKSLISTQYTALDQVIASIAQISELNLVYLMLKQGQDNQGKTKPAIKEIRESKTKKVEKEANASPLTAYIRRAQDCLDNNDFTRAIAELRDALKREPNHSTCHGLLGLAYLKQNQLTMAKVHINKAWQSNPKDPVALKAKQELDKLIPSDNQSKTSGNGGILGGLFGGKKK